jgi:hypothetical protein
MAMCDASRVPHRGAKIRAFHEALQEVGLQRGDAAIRAFYTAQNENLTFSMTGSLITSLGAQRVAEAAVEHGVPVAVVNFLAGLHLSPDTLPKE